MPLLGRVLKFHSNFYYVQTDDGTLYECFLRALLKKEGLSVIVGDRVSLQKVQESGAGQTYPTAWITGREPRENQLTRPKIANISQVMVVHPVSPDGTIADLLALDRVLLHVSLAALPSKVCLSKIDLLAQQTRNQLDGWLSCYKGELGYDVFLTSVHQPDLILAVAQQLSGNVSVMAGLSGAGKSSLLNAIWPDWRLKIAANNTVHGVHTTRHVELLPLVEQGWVADTPGFRLLSFDETDPMLLAKALPEATDSSCLFDDCLHLTEQGCAVKDRMVPHRYEHYQQFQQEASQFRQTVLATSQKVESGVKQLDRAGQGHVGIVRLKAHNRAESRRSQKQSVEDEQED